MATHSSVLAWRIPGTGEPGGLPYMGLHRVGCDWSELAAAAAKRFHDNFLLPLSKEIHFPFRLWHFWFFILFFHLFLGPVRFMEVRLLTPQAPEGISLLLSGNGYLPKYHACRSSSFTRSVWGSPSGSLTLSIWLTCMIYLWRKFRKNHPFVPSGILTQSSVL